MVGAFDGGRLTSDSVSESQQQPPAQVVLDLDATDDAVHGNQEGRFFHGYYGHYCYLPLYITCGEHLLCCRLRRADADAADGAVDELAPIVAQIRQRWPATKILVRGDSGFCREQIMAWCEGQGIDYVLGLARNARLQQRIDKALRKSRRRCATTGQASRRFRELRYRTLKSWSRHRRVVAKAEWLAGARGGDPRFVVTSLDRQTIAKQALYEELYCARGDMENRIKEQQLWLFADRTSAATMRANQVRLYFSAFAGILLTILRRAGLKGTVLANVRFDTIRSRLIKLAGRITVSVRRADRGKEENRGSKALSRSLPRSIRRSVLAVIRPPCRAMWPFMVPYSPAKLVERECPLQVVGQRVRAHGVESGSSHQVRQATWRICSRCGRDGLSVDGDVDAVAGLLVVVVHDIARLAGAQRLSNPVDVAAVLAEERRVRQVEQG